MKGVTHVTAKQVAAAMQSFEEMMGDDPMWSELKRAAVNPGEFSMTRSPQAANDLSDVDSRVTR